MELWGRQDVFPKALSQDGVGVGGSKKILLTNIRKTGLRFFTDYSETLRIEIFEKNKYLTSWSRDSLVDIATGYGLDD
jgi:hypothetical protein